MTDIDIPDRRISVTAEHILVNEEVLARFVITSHTCNYDYLQHWLLEAIDELDNKRFVRKELEEERDELAARISKLEARIKELEDPKPAAVGEPANGNGVLKNPKKSAGNPIDSPNPSHIMGTQNETR